MRNISFLLCTFNEELFIKKTIEKIRNKFQDAEIVIVDDNSSDKTVEIINKIDDKNLVLIQRKKVRGLASAFCCGIQKCKNSYIGWLDTNMEYVIDKFETMIKEIENNYDLVILSRYVAGGRDERNILRVFSSRILNAFCRFYLTNKIKDFSSGIFLMRKEVLNEILPFGYGHGEFFIEFMYRIYKSNFYIKEIPYTQKVDEVLSNSKTAPNISQFFRLAIHYFIRVIITKLRIN